VFTEVDARTRRDLPGCSPVTLRRGPPAPAPASASARPRLASGFRAPAARFRSRSGVRAPGGSRFVTERATFASVRFQFGGYAGFPSWAFDARGADDGFRDEPADGPSSSDRRQDKRAERAFPADGAGGSDGRQVIPGRRPHRAVHGLAPPAWRGHAGPASGL